MALPPSSNIGWSAERSMGIGRSTPRVGLPGILSREVSELRAWAVAICVRLPFARVPIERLADRRRRPPPAVPPARGPRRAPSSRPLDRSMKSPSSISASPRRAIASASSNEPRRASAHRPHPETLGDRDATSRTSGPYPRRAADLASSIPTKFVERLAWIDERTARRPPSPSLRARHWPRPPRIRSAASTLPCHQLDPAGRLRTNARPRRVCRAHVGSGAHDHIVVSLRRNRRASTSWSHSTLRSPPRR